MEQKVFGINPLYLYFKKAFLRTGKPPASDVILRNFQN